MNRQTEVSLSILPRVAHIMVLDTVRLHIRSIYPEADRALAAEAKAVKMARESPELNKMRFANQERMVRLIYDILLVLVPPSNRGHYLERCADAKCSKGMLADE